MNESPTQPINVDRDPSRVGSRTTPVRTHPLRIALAAIALALAITCGPACNRKPESPPVTTTESTDPATPADTTDNPTAAQQSDPANPPVSIDGGFFEVMGTFGHIIAVAPDTPTAQSAIQAARDEVIRIDAMMSDYKPDSALSRVNARAAAEPVPVDPELFAVLQRSLDYSRRTDGAFDITVGPLVDLWHRAAKEEREPTPDERAAVAQRVGYDKLHLDPDTRTVRFAVDGMRLDLGGIAKGYAIDRAVERMKTAGALGGLVDLGGDLRCFGTPPRGRPHWTVGLQDPRNDRAILLKLRLCDRAVATSGDYRRFVVIDGRRHSHIIDPARRDGAVGLTSTTIIAPTATDADALATAVSVMGPQKGLQWVDAQPDIEAILIESDSARVIYSATARQFVTP